MVLTILNSLIWLWPTSNHKAVHAKTNEPILNILSHLLLSKGKSVDPITMVMWVSEITAYTFHRITV